MTDKREFGQYFTLANPFRHPAFLRWAKAAVLPSARELEPFAGNNSLIGHLEQMGLCRDFASFDIHPADSRVEMRDTLGAFPGGFDVCVTNPPWLAKNSATVRGLSFPECRFDDLYKFALEKCLDNCGSVAALVPGSFVRSGLFRPRLTDFVSLTSRLFQDTGHPVGLALFQPRDCGETAVWSNELRVGTLCGLERMRPRPIPEGPAIRFNEPDGNVGLIALDNTREASIRFCDVRELAGYSVRSSGRHITRLHVDGRVSLEKWNRFLSRFRAETHDVLMTCYKGVRSDGMYRRRLDWQLARGIIHCA